MGPLHVVHLTQERSKRGQDGQMPDPGDLHLLIQSSCTIFRTFVILSGAIAEIMSFLQHRGVQDFL